MKYEHISQVSLNRDLFAPGCTLERHPKSSFKLGQINIVEIIMPRKEGLGTG